MDEVNFDALTYDEARKLQPDTPVWHEQNRAYVGATDDGDTDHWQEGLGDEDVPESYPAGYIGPLPTTNRKIDPSGGVYVKELRRVFTSEDVLSDVVGRRESGVLGSSPDAKYKQPGSEDASEEETDAFTAYEEQRDLLETWRSHMRAFACTGESFLRIRMARRRVTAVGEDGEERTELMQPDGDDAEEIITSLYVEQVDVGRAAHVVDSDTMQEGIICFTEDKEGEGMAEVTYVDQDNLTVLKTLYEGDREPEAETFDLGGHMLMHRSTLDLFLTESMRDNQRALNTTRTMIEKTNHMAGFPMVFFKNIEPPTDEEGNPVPLKTGPGEMAFVTSVPQKQQDAQGNEFDAFGGASVEVVEPAKIDNLSRSASAARHAVYRGAKQLHVMMAGDATASGESRIQARSEYVSDLEKVAPVMNRAGKWTMEVLWRLASALSGTQQDEMLEADFACRIDPGPVTPAMQTALLSALDKRALSLERYMRLTGVEDTEAERERIKQDLEDFRSPRERAETQRVEAAVQREQGQAPEAEVQRRIADIERGAAEQNGVVVGGDGAAVSDEA